MPLLILLGLPPTVANATNRVGVFAQSLAAVGGFKQESVPGLREALGLLPVMAAGAWVGAWFASEIPDELFGRLFAVVMLAMLPVILRNPKPAIRSEHPADASSSELRVHLPRPVQWLVYFGIGLYAGAIQAGIGIPLLLALVAAGGLDLVRANSVKVALVAVLTAVALAQFAAAGKVLWGYGLVLAVGSALGGYAGSRFGARVGPRLIQPILTIAVVAAALRLLFWPV